jgi:hypothetical protein
VISAGVFLDVPPLPPATYRPKSAARSRTASLSAPHTVVVTPLECQSKPSTQPNAWNQNGSDSRRSTSSGPYSATRCARIARASRTMRPNSQGGARPVCSGRLATPVRLELMTMQRQSSAVSAW